MKLTVYNSKPYDRESFNNANESSLHEILFVDAPLNISTAALAENSVAICIFVNDLVDKALLDQLYTQGVRLIALRCAGYNNVDIEAAHEIGIQIVNVPAYSPYAVAEHALSLILALNRHIVESNKRVHSNNFSLDGLKGFDLHGKTAGILGAGRIGGLLACSLQGIGMNVLAVDPIENPECCNKGVDYVDMNTLLAQSDIISLHCPLVSASHHLIDYVEVSKMKNGVMIINTSRGGVLNTDAMIDGLKSGKIGYLGMDVYEYEKDLFFNDMSSTGINDSKLTELLSMPNVLITPHQAFFTVEALDNIANSTLASLTEFEQGKVLTNEI